MEKEKNILENKMENKLSLSDEEQYREMQIHKRFEKIMQELLFIAKFAKHKQIYAYEKDKKLRETTTEEVVRTKGNIIIDEVIQTYSKITEGFLGIEEKLAALVFHNPEAINNYHDDVKRLKLEAENLIKKRL